MSEMKSKSQKKRDAAQLQALGITLVALREELLNELPLSVKLRTAIAEAKRLKSHSAVRRQALWIGKLLRDDGAEDISAAFAQLQARASNQTALFHVIEAWRTRLLADEPGALSALIAAYPAIAAQTLRQHIKKAQDEQQRALHTGASRALFRYLRSIIE